MFKDNLPNKVIFVFQLLLFEFNFFFSNFFQECQEYGKLVYQSEQSPILGVDAGVNSVSKCGIVETPLIVAGTKAQLAEFPHMALIGYGSPVSGWHCGGSIISETTILSAAHCISHPDGVASVVRVGIINQQDVSNMQEIPIAQTISHPEYNSEIKYNDIVLFKLASQITFTQNIRPACLNTDPNLAWEKAIVIGFGQISSDGPTSNDLMKVVLSNYAREDCVEAYKSNAGMPQGLLKSQFCAGEVAGGKDSCQGDSGGPIQIVLKDPYCMYSIIGVVSFGKLCGFANSPGIYTKLANYIPWIEQNAWN